MALTECSRSAKDRKPNFVFSVCWSIWSNYVARVGYMGCFMLLQYDLGVDWVVSNFVRNPENSFVIRSK